MREDLQEQACWLALVFESGLPIRIINDILVVWCKQLGNTLKEFFAAGPAEGAATGQRKAAMGEKLERGKVQMHALQPKIDAGKVLLLSQFHPDAPWQVSRAMERNHVVTGLAQVVIVAESDSKGGTWEGAHNALKQGRSLYVRQADNSDI